MGTEAINIEGALALELGMTLDIQGSFLRTVGTVGEGVDSAALNGDVDALAILHMDGCTAESGALVGEGEAAKLHCALL